MRSQWFLQIYIFILYNNIHIYCSKWRCFSGTISNYLETSLENAPTVLNTAYLKKDKPTIVYAFGYEGSFDNITKAITEGFLTDKNVNVCLLDWQTEANSYLPSRLDTHGLNYPLVVILLKKVAKKMGDALVNMSNNGLNLDTFTCVGHSLGAQLCGAIGTRVKEQDKQIGCIGAFEPASVFFQYPVKLFNSVDKSCAKFVYIVHTDMWRYGIRDSRGHIDIWVNVQYYVNNKVQPSCNKNPIPLSSDSFCSHRMAYLLLIESLRNPESLIASKAKSYTDWSKGIQENSTTYISHMINTSSRGDFFMCTNESPPYGIYKSGLNPQNCPK